MKAILVGGNFDKQKGKPSKLMATLYDSLVTAGLTDRLSDFFLLNGGNYYELQKCYELDLFKGMDYVFWFANVDNDLPKLVENIKKNNQNCILITSKRNFENEYTLGDIIQRALRLKSNLIVEFSGNRDNVQARVLDPLGNLILDSTTDFTLLGHSLAKRAKYLHSLTRISSLQIGDEAEIPDETEFFDRIKIFARHFDILMPQVTKTERFLGNASFRCQRGFPSFRKNELIYISQRNIEKKYIDKSGFVAVNSNCFQRVEYYGSNKPSVDAPIQVRLYNSLRHINYMIHGHVYVTGAPMTCINVPCGAIEEVEEILRIWRSMYIFSEISMSPYMYYGNSKDCFCINLRGHGFIAGWKDESSYNNTLFQLEKMFISRPFPEKLV